MEIRRILLALSSEAPAEAAVRAAAGLARLNGAAVDAVCLFPEPPTDISDSFAVGRSGVAQALARREAKVRDLTGPAQGAFREALAGAGLEETWSVGETQEAAEDLMDRARLADLVVIAHPSRDPDFRALTERLLLSSGAPCLVAPGARAPSFARIVIAWNGSREARRAVDDALPLLQRASSVEAVVVGGEPLRQAEQGEALVRRLASHGVRAELVREEVRGRSAGDALLAHCAAVRADLLVMGAYGHSRAAELVLGGATRTMLAAAPLPVLFAH